MQTIYVGPKKTDIIHYYEGYLDLSGQSSLVSLPDDLTVSGWLDLSYCTSVVSLPKNLKLTGSLNLRGCTSLQFLPDGLCVSYYLSMNGCTSLQYLPNNLTVLGKMYLNGCNNLQCLPSDLTVTGDIYLHGCTAFMRHFENGVYSYIDFSAGAIVGRLEQEIVIWCSENHIDIINSELIHNDYKIVCPVIHDPAQLMHYRLRWG